ncbi:MAG: hypothetical protein JNJ59_00585, partial [Deltaproteobacteria bacterium]|nr:hypothetical protein [Deltaproteobacteria bacterium]
SVEVVEDVSVEVVEDVSVEVVDDVSVEVVDDVSVEVVDDVSVEVLEDVAVEVVDDVIDVFEDGSGDVADDGDDTSDPPPTPLGLNDVTFLLPLPASVTASPLDGPAMLPTNLFTRLVTGPGDILATRADFVVVAVRFDLCDRLASVPCAPGSDPVLRVVLQPFVPGVRATRDVAVHVFFAIDVSEAGDLVLALRDLAALGATVDPRPTRPLTRPLEVNPLLADATSPYARDFVALVTRYADPAQLIRMTTFGQVGFESQRWHMRGLVGNPAAADGFADIVIPGLGASTQEVRKQGPSTYVATPFADSPPGFGLALDATAFLAASASARSDALAALSATDHPLATVAETIPCMTCHASTFIADQRGLTVSLDPASFPGRFASRFDLAPLGTRHGFTLRALGYFNDAPLVSRRVAAESAEVVEEIEAAFP